MQIERQLAQFVCGLQTRDIPDTAQRIVRLMMLAVTGTGIAGAAEEGIDALRGLLVESGGAPQATVIVFGDRLPAHAAAQLNGTMCRALDYCDAMAPGPHIGAALFPAALAAAELAGGCSGSEFMAALAAGAELSSRLNLSEAQYDGFDPTGIAVVFAATAAASRILGLTAEQTHHALALAFNRCGGSFQSNVDGSLAVRVIQGWVAEAGVRCAQLARLGVTGPLNFISGHYGYRHLYGRGTLDVDAIGAGLGDEWRLQRVVFKKYPSCGVTQGVTELALAMAGDGLQASDVERAEVRLPPYAHKLVGKAFDPGANPRVDGQFSAAYCVANALIRRASRLSHFVPAEVLDPALRRMADRIDVLADPALDARGHTAVDLRVTTVDGRVLSKSLDIAPGFPGADLDDAQHLARFRDCLAYAPRPPAADRVERYLASLESITTLDDVRPLVPLLVA
ncbi:MAG: MmgE/PrpD family protein [Gammaproteobacteria bacterium]|nr:MmgE/PrpD family protein [Gammaproteobacteria bacterium]MBU1442789.1 MmgE/PrpD family protein [Gammaproteobacteria bacterium]MBU2286378.1 MmgE/PrpD family protein [Gammaproteobacteria bacterium]